MSIFFLRLFKLIKILNNYNLSYGFFIHGVFASAEHIKILKDKNLKTIVDIGANKGQFSLICLSINPEIKIYSFEPLKEPAKKYRKLFSNAKNVKFYNFAIGEYEETKMMNVSAKADSSSFLTIGQIQIEKFPGTECIDQLQVDVVPLNKFIKINDINSPALLKIDVQGFELNVLKGCLDLLSSFEWIYCECSFIELYDEQTLASEIIEWLYKNNFKLAGIYNTHYDRKGLAIQSDFLFKNIFNK